MDADLAARPKAVAPALKQQLQTPPKEGSTRLPPIRTGSLRYRRNMAFHSVSWQREMQDEVARAWAELPAVPSLLPFERERRR
eukprot:9516868-Prorocentrum_lima.AAC.1